MIQCYICDRWYHHTCVGFSKEKMKQLFDPKTIWVCKFEGCEIAFGDIFESN